MKTALTICPKEIGMAVDALTPSEQLSLEELRLRVGQPVFALLHGREVALQGTKVDAACLDFTLSRASGQAVYSVQDMLRQGFVTLQGGHRLGICGTAVYKCGELFTLKEISSINLRIARQIKGIAHAAADFVWTRPKSTLIIGPPGRGKTTLLRDLILQLSNRFLWRISVADERMEIAAAYDGENQFDLGEHTDVLSGVRKSEGIAMLTRTMNPQWIAVDEITSHEDVEAMLRASYCGVNFLATAHANSAEDLHTRSVYRSLLECGMFENLLKITSQRLVVAERLCQID